MNREIKFRVWKTETKEWVTLFNRHVGDKQPIVSEVYTSCDYFILQQYTGLKDKYGKEIYEGDILRSHEGVIREVIWYIPDSAWRLKEKNGNVTMSFKGWVFDTTIIGNIYENPELLK